MGPKLIRLCSMASSFIGQLAPASGRQQPTDLVDARSVQTRR
jgi:hypothetical protein